MLIIFLLSTTVLLTNSSCLPGMLVVYRLSLRTEWNEKTFPKQFPQWRPSAQWSKTVGYSHSSTSAAPLFSIGSTVSEGVRQFAETGSTDTLDLEATNKTFLDTIISPPIGQGEGETTTTIFVDTNHTKVSVMTKLVPSPDWFVGLDSLDLCSQGVFIESVTTEAFPLDAGTDNGFTFTSPNWATQPRGEVFTMTSTFPAHPAGSFNYPHLARLPTLAVYSLTKLREYALLQHQAGDRQGHYTAITEASTVANDSETSTSLLNNKLEYESVDGFDADKQSDQNIFEFIPLESTTQKEIQKAHRSHIHQNESIPRTPRHSYRKSKVSLLGSKPSNGFRSSSSISGYHASTSPDNFFKKKYNSKHLRKAQRKVFTGSLNSVPKSELYQHILAHYKKGGIQSKKKKLRRRKHKKSKKPRNCLVTAWGAWGPCSKTCGIGESVRVRMVAGQSHHGLPCPALTEYRWCGSARNCKEGYFKW
eukprot:GFUD01021487.1.p1 GENE.GFUD01021487.1~~GFUD01021487.1.p1  ORF type:complete len:476 (+),score=137.91 GFUD01021487.1:85-1512(+)